MVYLKGIFVVKTTLIVVLLGLLLQHVSASHTRIAYKKPIAGSKPNKLREKRMRPTKTEVAESTTEATAMPLVNSITDKATSTACTEEAPEQSIIAIESTTDRKRAAMEETMVDKETNSISTTESTNTPVPCTCGIFLASQIKRGTAGMPEGKAVITNELDRHYTCNAVGQKQCQTKCLETIVQHLPNSANILCATLNRDCRKERAYLFIKNCRHQWINTNLAAGREYCCKNGQPYQCPMA